jgi:putative glycosyltransferase (TIGR04372 family)
MLGRAHLLLGNISEAAKWFKRAVALAPSTVMAHHNYAGRYDIHNYKPFDWELRRAGALMVYDNFGQIAEDFFLLGKFEASFRCYQQMLDFQKRWKRRNPLPLDIRKALAAAHSTFDIAKPTRLLPYEWVTQFGHIGLLDSYLKMAKLGMYPDANYVLLAPEDKVVNPHYLAYWDDHFTIVRDRQMVDALFPFQRILGDNFMAYPATGGTAEPWTRAAARAQTRWAEEARAAILEISESDRRIGERALRQFGLPEGAWYVALHVREGGYYGESTGSISAHRNSRIEDYFPAINDIVARGGYVIRLGDKSMRPIPNMPNLIDYALSHLKSPELDIFLCATSRFVIGTTSGLTTACLSFGTPMVLVNCISNDWQLWSGDTDFTVKPVYNLRERRTLSFAETFSMPVQGYLINSQVMRRNGLVTISNTEEEITDAIRFKLDLMDGTIERSTVDAHPLMQRYRTAMQDNPFMFAAARPALPFLERHPELLIREPSASQIESDSVLAL